MKHLRKLIALAVTLAMVMSLSVSGAFAENTTEELPGSYRYYYYEDDAWGNTVDVTLGTKGQRIENLKSSSSSLKVMISNQNIYESNEETRIEYYIGMLAKTTGTYTVSFDIVNKKGTVVKSHKFKVYAYPSPVSKVTVGGSTSRKLSGTSGAVKVTLKDGNTISKLEFGKYKKKTEDRSSGNSTNTYTNTTQVFSEIKNGGTITYSKVPSYYESNYKYSYASGDYSYSSESYRFRTDCFAPNFIRITYKDKYTKKNEVITQTFWKKCK